MERQVHPAHDEKHKSSSHPEKSYKDPIPTVDMILRRTSKNPKEILIETRGRPPFEGEHCIPGGHVDYGETVEAAVLRELKEETSLHATLVGILGVYSDPNRDPRGQRISTVFIGNCVGNDIPGAGDDAKTALWMSLDEVLNKTKIAFDHRLILEDYNGLVEKGSLRDSTFWSTKPR